MARLRGTGLGAGMAMGAAAVVRVRGGVSLMPEPPQRIAAMVAQRRLTEVPDVVLAADDYRTAIAIAASLAWARVVGIVTERDDPDAAIPWVPAVTGIVGLMQTVSDDVLVLVDATRGVALIEPDPIYLAQYTAEHDRIAPKNRIYLDEEHLPAQTVDGRTISVVATTEGRSIQEVLSTGPDALYHSLPLTFDPGELRSHLDELITIAAGKPLIVRYNPSLPLSPILEAASSADVTLAIAPREGAYIARPELFSRLAEEIALTEAECSERDILTGPLRIAAEIRIESAASLPERAELEAAIESAAATGVTRLFLETNFDPQSMEGISNLTAVAGVNLMPVTVSIADNAICENLRNLRIETLLIGAGASGILVRPDQAVSTKQTIRAATISECEQHFQQFTNHQPLTTNH